MPVKCIDSDITSCGSFRSGSGYSMDESNGPVKNGGPGGAAAFAFYFVTCLQGQGMARCCKVLVVAPDGRCGRLIFQICIELL